MALSRRSLLKAGAAAGGLLAYGGAAELLLQDDRWEPNESHWIEKTPWEASPPAQGNVRVDVAIVGAGFTGLSAAHHVKTRFPDMRVAVFEAKRVGFGASGRNGGLLVQGTTGSGSRTRDSVRFAKQLIEANGLACDLRGNQIDPYMLVVALARLCRRHGVLLFEDSAIRRVVAEKPARIVGDGFAVEADTVILGTNAYTPRLGVLRRTLLPLHTGTIVTEPLGPVLAELPSSFVFPIRGGMDYYWGRTLPDRRLLFGGGIRYAYDNGLSFPGAPHLYAALDQAMRRNFPALQDARVTHRWNGPMAFFADSRARMGSIGPHGNVHYALGYAGNGVALAIRFGHLLAEWLDGTPPPSWTTAAAQWLPSEPFRYALVNAGLHLVDFGLVKV